MTSGGICLSKARAIDSYQLQQPEGTHQQLCCRQQSVKDGHHARMHVRIATLAQALGCHLRCARLCCPSTLGLGFNPPSPSAHSRPLSITVSTSAPTHTVSNHMCKGLDETGYQEAHSAFRTGHDSSAQQCHSGPEATATRRTPDQTKIKLGIITARMAHGMQHGAALLDTTNWPAGAWHTIRPQNWAKRHHIYTATTWHNSTKAAPLQQHSV